MVEYDIDRLVLNLSGLIGMVIAFKLIKDSTVVSTVTSCSVERIGEDVLIVIYTPIGVIKAKSKEDLSDIKVRDKSGLFIGVDRVLEDNNVVFPERF